MGVLHAWEFQASWNNFSLIRVYMHVYISYYAYLWIAYNVYIQYAAAVSHALFWKDVSVTANFHDKQDLVMIITVVIYMFCQLLIKFEWTCMYTQPYIIQAWNIMKLIVLLFLLCEASPLLAYRDGARENSCYDHSIDHGEGTGTFDCVPPSCPFFLRIREVVDNATLELGNETTNTYQCGEIYGSKRVHYYVAARDKCVALYMKYIIDFLCVCVCILQANIWWFFFIVSFL